MNPLNANDLDKIIDNGCSVPGCKHEHHNQLFLHARCHVDGQTSVAYEKDSVLRVDCGKCGKLICRIDIADKQNIIKCHTEAPLEVEYTKGRHKVRIYCNQCKTQLADIPVKETT